jgi:outer membrane protein TolC
VREHAPAGALRDRILPPVEATAPTEPPLACPAAETEHPEADRAEHDEAAAWLPGHELTLERAIELAYRCSPRLRVMAERVEQARAGKQVAFAEFLPEANTSYRLIAGSPRPFALPTLPTLVGNLAFGGESDHFLLAELHLQWTVWDFGKTSAKFGQAVAAVDIAELQYQRARQTLEFNVTAAYFAVLQAQATRLIAEEAVRRAEAVLRDARNFLKRGTAIRNDVLRAEVLLAETQLALVSARTAEALAVAGLNRVIGINVSCPTQVVPVVQQPTIDVSLFDCLQLAADHRDEFGVVLRTIESAQLATRVARSEFFPRVYVGGTGAHQDTADQRRSADIFTGGINLELGLFEGGRRVGRLRGASAEVRAAVAQGQEICDQIAYEVHAAYLAVIDARQRRELTRTAATQATENLRVVRHLLEKGDATPTDVVDAELALVRAQQNDANALYDYQTAIARLVYAVGADLVTGGQKPVMIKTQSSSHRLEGGD